MNKNLHYNNNNINHHEYFLTTETKGCLGLRIPIFFVPVINLVEGDFIYINYIYIILGFKNLQKKIFYCYFLLRIYFIVHFYSTKQLSIFFLISYFIFINLILFIDYQNLTTILNLISNNKNEICIIG